MAFVLPLLILVVVGIIDFGFLFQRYETVTNAAREGARVGVLPGYQDADIVLRVNAYLTAAGLPQAVAATCATTPPAMCIQRTTATPVGGGADFTVVNVTVRYPHTFMFIGPIAALFGGSFGTVTLTGVSAMRAEMTAGG